MSSQPTTPDHTGAAATREQVRDRYAHAARQVAAGTTTDGDGSARVQPTDGCGCGQPTEGSARVQPTDGCGCGQPADGCGCGQPADCGCADTCCATGAVATAEGAGFGAELYTTGERGDLPETALLASLGCGNPTAVADLGPGETVLDLGSGGGIDVLLSARRVGPGGKAYGLDMTEEMLALARRNAAEAGATNVDFLKGNIEAIPLPADTVDVVISNCVINLSVDKPAVFAEMRRVLVPGGRIGVSDVVAEDRLSAADRAERGNWVGCIAGALSSAEYQRGLAAAGFERISVTFTHQVAEGLHGAIIKAVKPGGRIGVGTGGPAGPTR